MQGSVHMPGVSGPDLAAHTGRQDNPHQVTAAQVGAMPVVNAKSSSYDMDTILKSGPHNALYATNDATLGTPYKNGVSRYANAIILSHAISDQFGTQFVYSYDGYMYSRTLVDGVMSEWVCEKNFGLQNATQIPANADLNDYMTPGYYSCPANAVAETQANVPIASAYQLAVDSRAGVERGYCMQTLVTYEGRRMYRRVFYHSEWSQWHKVYTSADKPTAADVGAAPASHNHSATNITSGTLAVARGGTGQTTVQALRNSMGLGNTTGALPIANGGTGKTTAADALAALGGLSKAGGTMTGYISYTMGGYTSTPISVMAGNENGHLLRIQAGGDTILASGEAGTSIQSALGIAGTSETMHIAADSTISLHTNCQTIADRKTVTIDKTGKITAPGGFSGTLPVANVSGTLPVNKGGTGATTAAAALTALGAAAASHNHSAANITSGTLPVARGGTGQTSIGGLKTALGLPSSGYVTRTLLASTSLTSIGVELNDSRPTTKLTLSESAQNFLYIVFDISDYTACTDPYGKDLRIYQDSAGTSIICSTYVPERTTTPSHYSSMTVVFNMPNGSFVLDPNFSSIGVKKIKIGSSVYARWNSSSAPVKDGTLRIYGIR